MQLGDVRFRYDWRYPTTIRSGAGRIAALGDGARALGIASPSDVTDAGFASLPPFGPARDCCRSAGPNIPVFTDVQANPTAENVAGGDAIDRHSRSIPTIELDGTDAEEIELRAADICAPTNGARIAHDRRNAGNKSGIRMGEAR